MIAVELLDDVDTLGGTLPRGRRLFVSAESEEVVNLGDTNAVQRVSCCPRGKVRFESKIFTTEARRHGEEDGGVDGDTLVPPGQLPVVGRGSYSLGPFDSVIDSQFESGPSSSFVPPCLRGESSPSEINQANAELRDRTPAEVCPFDLLPAAPPLRDFTPSREAPQSLPIVDYVSTDRLAWANAKRFPHRASEHSQRGAWGPEWNIAEYGVLFRERVIYSANYSLAPLESGTLWQHFVDLDRGEFRDWTGPWQCLRRGNDNDPQITQMSQISNPHSESVESVKSVDLFPLGEPHERTFEAVPVPSAGDLSAGFTDEDRSARESSAIDSGLRQTTNSDLLCGPGEYPAPSCGMTVDELRGWRRVKDERGGVCGRFGPDRAEDFPRWREWLGQLKQCLAQHEGVAKC